MTRTTIALLASAAMVIASAVSVSGQGKKGSAPKPPHVTTSKPTTTVKASPSKPTSGPKNTMASQSRGPKTTTTKGPKTTTVKATGSTKTKPAPATKSAKTSDTKKPATLAKSDTKKYEKSTTTTTTKTTTQTTGDTPVTLTKVQERLQKNTKLAEKLESRLPKGTDLMGAAEDFRNLGQFVAAVNVSHNLGLDFDKLKTAMVDDGKSLGQAIQYVKKDVESPTLVAQRAESEATTLIQETERQSTATTTTTTTTSTTTTKAKSKDRPKRTIRTQSGS